MLWYIIIVSILMITWYLRRRHTMSLLKRCGIPGPEPHLIFGNIRDKKNLNIKSLIDKQKYLIETYGNVVGYYIGEKPIVLIADPELAKLVMVKDFDKFRERAHYLSQITPSHLGLGSLLLAKGERWKHIRGLLSTAFTPNKLKAMNQMLSDSIDSFLTKADQMSDNGQELEIYDLLQRLSAEMIIKTAFGYHIDAQNDKQNNVLKAFIIAVDMKFNKYLALLTSCFRALDYLIQPIRDLFDTFCIKSGLSTGGILWTTATKMLESRKKDPTLRKKDFLQSMIDSYLSEHDINSITEKSLTANNLDERDDSKTEGSKKAIVLTEDEIKANAILFYLAGFETSSTAMSYAVHFLVNYPEQQERIRQEIQDVFEKQGVMDYSLVQQLKYMECFLTEVMRFYPPFLNALCRESMTDYKYKDIVIPKGAMISLCTHYMHTDPEYWPEPDHFDPTRFAADRKGENNSGSYLTFGIGPRNCLGMRMAFYSMRLTLAKLLIKYRIEIGPSTEIGSVTLRYKAASTAPKNGVWVKLVKI